jgi:hypothetical protein
VWNLKKNINLDRLFLAQARRPTPEKGNIIKHEIDPGTQSQPLSTKHDTHIIINTRLHAGFLVRTLCYMVVRHKGHSNLISRTRSIHEW